MWDVYLGGLSDQSWRTKVKSEISRDISIFDPMTDNYDTFDEGGRANEIARQLLVMQERCEVLAFYLNIKWQGHSTLLEIGDAVGRGAQVIVCLDGNVRGSEKIQRYCEYHGVIVVNSLDGLVTTIEEYMKELELVGDGLEVPPVKIES